MDEIQLEYQCIPILITNNEVLVAIGNAWHLVDTFDHQLDSLDAALEQAKQDIEDFYNANQDWD